MQFVLLGYRLAPMLALKTLFYVLRARSNLPGHDGIETGQTSPYRSARHCISTAVTIRTTSSGALRLVN